jgi:hypothetical protein
MEMAEGIRKSWDREMRGQTPGLLIMEPGFRVEVIGDAPLVDVVYEKPE